MNLDFLCEKEFPVPPRDPFTTARNKKIQEYKLELSNLMPAVLKETRRLSIGSLHGLIGGKNAEYIDLYRTIISKPDEFVSLWLEGYEKARAQGNANNLEEALKRSPTLKKYLYIFLKRTFLNEFKALSRSRPSPEDSEIWIGENNADYGLLVTPRFNDDGEWENDNSEIRRFEKEYWTIGHILETGLVVPGSKRVMKFPDVETYLTFFRNTLVRNSSSVYERNIADLYIDYVENVNDPENIPLLIPEFRYGGKERRHKYRLDFTIISELAEHKRVGFELSPWSSHGYLAKTKGLSQKDINEMAQNNFEDEMEKHKNFLSKHGVFVRIYTDRDLKNISKVFEDIKLHLKPKPLQIQLNLSLFSTVLGIKPNFND